MNDDLEEVLTCSVCYDRYKYPRQLPCQHTFCRLCLLKCIETSNAKGNVKFPCPHCRQQWIVPEEGFPTNIYLQQLLDLPSISRSCEALKAVPLPEPLTVFVPVQVYTTHLNEQPTLNLSERQVLFVSEAFNPGKFFGQFERIGTGEPISVGLEEMGIELKEAYSKLENPPKLYQTTEQRLLGYYGVKHDATDGKLSKPFIGNIFIVKLKLSFFLDNYCRVRIIQEDGPVVKLLLVDHGSIEFAQQGTNIISTSLYPASIRHFLFLRRVHQCSWE